MENLRLSDETIIQTMQGVIDLFLKPKFISLGMNATGQWLSSLEPRVEDGTGQIWGMDYTYWLVHGRAPNRDKDEASIRKFAVWAGKTFIKDWANAKGITIPPIAIAYKIGREGTDYYPEGTDLLEVLNSKEVTDYVYAQYREAFVVEISEILKKQIHDNFT